MSWIKATYRVSAPRDQIDKIAHHLALEQSVEVAAEVVTDPFVAENIMGRVAAVHPSDDGCHEVAVIRLAAATTGFDVAQTLNMLFGTARFTPISSSSTLNFRLTFWRAFRDLGTESGHSPSARVPDRALTCAALKPQGLSSDALAALCYELAANGVDIMKDDHGLADQSYSPFAERVPRASARLPEYARDTVASASTRRASWARRARSLQQARIARDEGVGAVLIAPALVGMPVFHELVDRDLDVPVSRILPLPARRGSRRRCCSASFSAGLVPMPSSFRTSADASPTARRLRRDRRQQPQSLGGLSRRRCPSPRAD